MNIAVLDDSDEIIATGLAGLKDLIPSLNDDFDFEVKLRAVDGSEGILKMTGILYDLDGLRGRNHSNLYGYNNHHNWSIQISFVEELRHKTAALDFLKQSKGIFALFRNGLVFSYRFHPYEKKFCTEVLT